eukprot:6217019-Prymnesium_polylepis.1
MCAGSDAAADERRRRAVKAGAVEVLLAAIRGWTWWVNAPCQLLVSLCADARGRQRAVAAGGKEVLEARISSDAGRFSHTSDVLRARLALEPDAEVWKRAVALLSSDPSPTLHEVVAAMRAHPRVAALQVAGCMRLYGMCAWALGTAWERAAEGTDVTEAMVATGASKQGAMEAGMIETVTAAMAEHPQDPAVLFFSLMALDVLVGDHCEAAEDYLGLVVDAKVVAQHQEERRARVLAVVEAGVVERAVAAMRNHLEHVGDTAPGLLYNVAHKSDERCRQRAVAALVVSLDEALVAAKDDINLNIEVHGIECRLADLQAAGDVLTDPLECLQGSFES